jgi:prepilin-type N-terminal cleavage/methylation domain-containing protein
MARTVSAQRMSVIRGGIRTCTNIPAITAMSRTSFLRRRRPAGRYGSEHRYRQLEVEQEKRIAWGVTLIEMLIVVMIIALIAGISFPALTAGLARRAPGFGSGIGGQLSDLDDERVERREMATAAIVISPKENGWTSTPQLRARSRNARCTMPQGIFHRRRRTATLSAAFPAARFRA